jgi:hypothetical protein
MEGDELVGACAAHGGEKCVQHFGYTVWTEEGIQKT